MLGGGGKEREHYLGDSIIIYQYCDKLCHNTDSQERRQHLLDMRTLASTYQLVNAVNSSVVLVTQSLHTLKTTEKQKLIA